MSYSVVVIGGGLAGCSAAAQLARRGHDVLLVEQSTYPRHKLCGEFLSPEAQSSFRRLGVLDEVVAAGAHPISETLLTAHSGATTRHALPSPALGLSRYRLDHLLFQHARALGADTQTGARVTAVHGSIEEGFAVDVNGESVDAQLVLGAYGRRSRLDRTLERPFLDQNTPYVAFKAHYAGSAAADVADTVELHGAPGAYCGLAPVEDERVNLCWIGTTDALQAAGGSPKAMLEERLRQNPILDDRLRELQRVSDRFEAVSQVPLMPKSRFANGVCMIGDSAGMIAPLCGDGMAMALEAADLATPLVSDLLNGGCTADEFRTAYERAWTNTFGRRMRIGRWVHAAAFRPGATRLLVNTSRFVPPLARWLIRATRGSHSSSLPT